MKQVYLKSIFLSLLMMVIGNVGALAAEEETIASFSASAYNGGTTNEWTVSNANYASAGGGYYQLITSNASIVTPSINWSEYSDITITISARKYGGPNETQGKISVSQGETELTSYSPSGTSIAASSALEISPEDGSITISCPGASSSKGCGVGTIVIKGTPVESDASLTSIEISGDYPTEFYVNDVFSHEGMTVTAYYDDGTDKDVTTNSNVTFSEPDMSTPAEAQTVTVSYTEGEVTKTATYTITVKDRTLMGLELSGDYPTEFNVGDTFSHEGLIVTANYDGGSSKDVSSLATIFPPDMTTPGEKNVEILYTEDVGEVHYEVNGSYTITVNDVAVTGITLDQETLTLKAGKTAQLTATIAPSNATDKSVTWSSSDETVATVDETGLVTAVATGTATITATAAGGSDVTATCAVTVAAASVADGYYVKVTEAPTNWSGEYLIVYERDNVAFNGSLATLDAVGNTIEVEIEEGKIPAYPEVKAAAFTIAKMEGGYSVKAASGKYIGATSYANSLVSSDTEIANSLSLDASGNAVVSVSTSGGGVTLRYNYADNQLRFRYYKSGQQAIQLYKKEVTATNEYTLVAGEEETPFEGLELTKELPAQTKFYVKDSNGNEYHSADAQSELIIIAENHENLETSAEGKDFYLSKANTWVFSLTEGDEGALTLTVSPQTEGETTYMLTSGYLQSSDDVFDENLKLTKEMTSTTEEFYFTRSDDYGLTNLTPASFNAPEDRRYWIFSEDAPTVDFIAGEIRGSYTVGETGLYTFSLDLTSKQVTATKIAKQYALVVGETEYPFDEQLTLTQELPAQTKFYVKDSEGNVYHSTDAQSEVIINAENHENLQTSTSPNNKNFYLSKANTWVFTLTEGEDGAVTLTVSPQTEGETKYMMTPDYAQESDDVFDANNQLTKEMTTEGFFIVRSDDYGLTNLTAAESNVQEGSNTYYIWEFSENAPTVGFIPGEIRNVFRMAEEGLYTFTLDLENKTVTAETATEVTATGNLNNSDAGVFAGQQGYTSGAHSYTGTFSTALGDVTVDYAGSPNSYLNGSEIRMYGDKATLTLTAPNGYAFKEIVFTGTDIANLIADVGTYDADNKIWTGSGEKTETTVIFTSSESKKNLKTVTVTLEEAAPKSPLAGIRVEGYTTDFVVGDTYTFDGTVTAVYEDDTEKDVTDLATFSEPDMSTAGEDVGVYVSYTEGEVTAEVTISINVREPETLTFRKVSSTDDLVAGKRYVLVNEENQKVITEYYNYHFEVDDATISDERVTLEEGNANFLTLGGEENAWTFATSIETGLYLALTSDANYLQLGDDNTVDAAQWTIEFDADGNAVIQSNNYAERYIRYNASQPRFACYKGTQQPIQLYVEFDEDDVDLTISTVGYATLYYSDRALKVPAGVTAKTYKVVGGKLAESKTYEAGKVIPKGEAVVLKGAAGDYTFLVSSTAEAPDADSKLKGSDEAEETTGGNYYYALQAKSKDGKHGPGMYWMNSTGAAFTNGAHKAYMALDEKFAGSQGQAKSCYLFDEATGIDSVVAEGIERGDVYNLNGQRVGSGYKGVVIVNGKKFMKK